MIVITFICDRCHAASAVSMETTDVARQTQYGHRFAPETAGPQSWTCDGYLLRCWSCSEVKRTEDGARDLARMRGEVTE